jgi:flavin-dependent dehydrogenase
VSTRFDALVVGAGPSGAAAAIALCRRGWRVALLDRVAEPAPAVGESLAGIARSALEDLGLWEAFRRQPAAPSRLVLSVWGDDRPQERHTLWSRWGPDWHIDRAVFDGWLVQEARDAGAEVLRPATIDELSRDERGAWRVRTGERVIEAGFVVDATGRAAWLSRRLGAARRQVDSLVAVARWFRGPSQPVILLEAARSGWWYSGPTPGDGLLVFLATEATLPAARSSRMEDWSRHLEEARWTRERIGTATPAGRPRVCLASPAVTSWDPRLPLLAVGDAAVAFDPLSGDGLCFALRSAIDAAEVLGEARAGATAALAAYQRGAHQVFRQHLERRAQLYRWQGRWHSSPFWKKQRSPGAVRRPSIVPTLEGSWR